MAKIRYTPEFAMVMEKMKDSALRERINKQILKIIENPEAGKPMKYTRKGTRELYVPPFRLSYIYFAEHDRIVVLDFYHKDEQ